RRALAVAAHVVVQDAVLVLERREGRVPHPGVAGERVAEDQPGRVALAGNFVVQLGAVHFRFHASSKMSGINISSSWVPPWLPMCSQRASPATQSFTV